MSIIESDVAVWYDLDEGTGTALDNAQGTASLDGTIINAVPTWTTDGPTNLPDSVDLDGANDGIRFNNTFAEAGASGDFSFSIWVENDTFSGTDTLFNDWGGSGNRRVLIRCQTTTLQFFISDNGTASEVQASVVHSQTGVMNHWVFTRAGNNTEIIKNGSSVATNTGSFTLVPSATDMRTGINSGETGESLDGKIAQMILIKKALTVTEAASLYNSGDGITWASMFSGGGGGFAFSQGVVIG